MNNVDLCDRMGNVISKITIFGCDWDVLDSFEFDFSSDEDYFLLSFNGNEVFCNNYYGYVVVHTADGRFLFRDI